MNIIQTHYSDKPSLILVTYCQCRKRSVSKCAQLSGIGSEVHLLFVYVNTFCPSLLISLDVLYVWLKTDTGYYHLAGILNGIY